MKEQRPPEKKQVPWPLTLVAIIWIIAFSFSAFSVAGQKNPWPQLTLILIVGWLGTILLVIMAILYVRKK